MEYAEKTVVIDNLQKYCYFAGAEDYIEVSVWESGEGFDIRIKDKLYTFTDGELDAMSHLRNCIRYKNDK